MTLALERETPAGTPVPAGAPAPIRPIGPISGAETLLVGSLMWGTATAVSGVLAMVIADDVEDPYLRDILAVIRSLSTAGRPMGGVMVADELMRAGQLAGDRGKLVSGRLADAVTSGASELAIRDYAAIVVADSYRRRFRTLGEALTGNVEAMPEDDLMAFLRKEGTEAARHSVRLSLLRVDSATKDSRNLANNLEGGA